MFSYSFGVGGVGEDLGGYSSNVSAGVLLDCRTASISMQTLPLNEETIGSFTGVAVSLVRLMHMTFSLRSCELVYRANHQIKLRLQWAGVKAYEDGLYQTQVGDDELNCWVGRRFQ